jgi:hypothetical protein
MILMASWETVLTSVVGYSSMRVFFELNLL